MRKVLTQTARRLRNGETVVWCVILESRGSTPRGIGAMMAVFADGAACGTVGGGAVELQATRFAMTVVSPVVRDYDLYSGGDDATGMVCGGTVKIAFLPVKPSLLPTVEALREALDKPEDLFLQIRTDDKDWQAVICKPEAGEEQLETTAFPPNVVWNADGSWVLTEPLSRNYRVYLFGAGHVSAALAPLLMRLEFPLTVVDPREELLAEPCFSRAARLCIEFEKISEVFRITGRDYVVVMTPGHEKDLTVLRQVLRTPASYIGCIGSKKKTAYVNRVLLEEGFSEAELARVHAPIGLPIGAKTPEEIAVSIAAEMIAHRTGTTI